MPTLWSNCVQPYANSIAAEPCILYVSYTGQFVFLLHADSKSRAVAAIQRDFKFFKRMQGQLSMVVLALVLGWSVFPRLLLERLEFGMCDA